MKPGIYFDIPFSDYLQIDAFSNSFLKGFATSPAHAIAETKTTTAMREGRLYHTLILEPQKADTVIRVIPDGNKNSAAFKDQIEATFGVKYQKTWPETLAIIEAAFPDVSLVDSASYAEIKAIADTLRKDSAVVKLLQNTQREVTIIWEREGLLCKARVDALGSWAVDLKSAQSSHPAAFAKQAVNLGYHRQDAWYMQGLQAVGVDVKGMAFIAFEKSNPVSPMIFTFTDETKAIAEYEIDYLFEIAAECKATGVYPSYEKEHGKVVSIELPAWYKPVNKNLEGLTVYSEALTGRVI